VSANNNSLAKKTAKGRKREKRRMGKRQRRETANGTLAETRFAILHDHRCQCRCYFKLLLHM
jgi:hypothetical protein